MTIKYTHTYITAYTVNDLFSNTVNFSNVCTKINNKNGLTNQQVCSSTAHVTQ